MTHEQIVEVLKLHKKWLLGLAEGVCADLSNANLISANLRNANLRYADLTKADLRLAILRDAILSGAILGGAILSDAILRDADLRDADLRYAILSDANLSDADLTKADLSGAKLIGANLFDANLRDADLSGADLSDADLTKADLSNADLRNANLSNAELRYANLRDADLRNADLSDANLIGVKTNCLTVGYYIACPEEGAFIGYKKAGGKIVVLEIPAEARRSSATSIKCRCDKAKVLRIENLDGTPAEVSEVSSDYNEKFKYRVGEVVESEFDENRWEECSKGIHFFINRNNAVTYQN